LTKFAAKLGQNAVDQGGAVLASLQNSRFHHPLRRLGWRVEATPNRSPDAISSAGCI
jgi:hypothetical protein